MGGGGANSDISTELDYIRGSLGVCSPGNFFNV